MRGLAAWLIVFWVIALPYNVYVIGNEYDGWGEVVSQVLVITLACIIANDTERAVRRHDARRRADEVIKRMEEANRG